METLVTKRIELPVRDGTRMFAELARPPGRPAGGIVLFQDAYGVNEQLREIAASFAQAGYVALAPELFHRTGDGIVAAYDDNRNALRMAAKDGLTLEGMRLDGEAAWARLTGEEGVPAERTGALGFCMGGRVAFLANAHLPLRFAVSFYGGGIAPDLLDLASRQHGALLMIWGGQDAHISAGQRRAVEDALASAGKPNLQLVFSQAKHGFFGPRHPDHDPHAAAVAKDVVFDFLRAELP